jgi:hypothetical protein
MQGDTAGQASSGTHTGFPLQLVRAESAGFDFGEHFGERVLDDREAEGGDFLEAAPAAGDERLLIADERGIELPFDGPSTATGGWKSSATMY